MKRRKAREYALQFLYRIDFMENASDNPVSDTRIKTDTSPAVNAFWHETGETDPGIKSFAEDIIKGTIKHLASLDKLIQEVAEHWKLSRIASVDRNILRAAVYELLHRKDIPSAVTINEAIEIAKKYSTAESASFINGILDKIAKERCA
ncbi:MAG: transcription antitermination factor NusB [Nitrospirae bacterium]|nr:MAG: transcription antitermination factor NusB [Nitrospirota bacterium]